MRGLRGVGIPNTPILNPLFANGEEAVVGNRANIRKVTYFKLSRMTFILPKLQHLQNQIKRKVPPQKGDGRSRNHRGLASIIIIIKFANRKIIVYCRP